MATSSTKKFALRLTSFSFLAILAGCGGGSMTDNTPENGKSINWTQGVFQPSSNFYQQCQALNEKHWLRSWSNETYLWYDEIIDRDPAKTTGVINYFDLLKTEQLTDSGAKKDNFHSNLPTEQWKAQSQSGVSFGYGFKIKLLSPSAPRQAIISDTESDTPASNFGLSRGYELLEVDGIDFINANSQAEVDAINAGLFPRENGKQTQFVFRDINTGDIFDVTFTSQSISAQPVKKLTTFANGEVGYFLFNSHNAVAEKQLFDTFNNLVASEVKELIIDMRYNGGGFLQMASQVAYMVAGRTNTQGKIFEQTIFNDQHPNFNPITGERLKPLLFTDEFVGFADNPALTPGTPLPSLNLDRVFVLTTDNTCSASEAVINGLRGAEVEVIQIGGNTCGKPYGFYPADNCGTTYFTIQFTGVNNKGFGEYSDGFAPKNSTQSEFQPVMIPGCAVADDFTHKLGDPNEAMLAAALNYRSTGLCPTASSTIGKQGFVPALTNDSAHIQDDKANNIFNNNRILGQ